MIYNNPEFEKPVKTVDFCRGRVTTIIVEQNAIAALHLSDRALILDMGEVVFDGTAKDVIENTELRQQYLAI